MTGERPRQLHAVHDECGGFAKYLWAFVGGAPSLTTQFQIPAGVAYGTQIFATAVALFMPNSLPNGQNAFGAVTSNSVASFISGF